MPNPLSDPAVSVCFVVKVDAYELGAFTSCDGLGCEVVMEQFEEGGEQSFVHQLPGRLKFSNVKLTRPVNSDSGKIAAWFSSMAVEVPRARGANITAMTLDGKTIAGWKLKGVVPVRWTGPQFGFDSAKVATETIELAHHGFDFAPGTRRS